VDALLVEREAREDATGTSHAGWEVCTHPGIPARGRFRVSQTRRIRASVEHPSVAQAIEREMDDQFKRSEREGGSASNRERNGTLADGASAAAVRQVTGGRVKEFRRKMQDLARRGQPPVDLGFPDNDPGKDGAEEATKAGMDAIVTGKTDNSPGNTNGDEPKLAS